MGFQLVKLLNEPINITFTGEITPMGEYNASVTYHIGESVSYGGSSYLARQDNIGHLPTETSFWQLLAEQGIQGPEGDGFPAGGTIGQVLTKDSNADYDAVWEDATGGGIDINDLTEKTHISQDDKRVVYDAENGYAAKFERVYSSQQIFEAYSQTEEDQIYTDHPNFPVMVRRKDLEGEYKLTASVASFVITPQSTNLDLSSTYPFQFENTEFTMIGNESDLRASRRLVCAVAELNLGFQEAILSYAPVSSYNLTASVGEFTYTPVDILTSRSYALTTTTTNFALTMVDSILYVDKFYDFGGAADSTIPSYFTTSASGSGTVRINGSGQLALSSPATTDGSLLYRTDQITIGQNKKYRLKFKANTGTATQVYMLEMRSIASKVSTNTGAWWAANSLQILYCTVVGLAVEFSYKPSGGGSALKWSGTAWGTTGLSYNVTADTYYWIEIETTTTQFRFTLYASDGTTVIKQSSFVNISALVSYTNPLWLLSGDPNTDGLTNNMLIDAFQEI